VWTEDEAVAAGHSVVPDRWQPIFDGQLGRIAGRFTRLEPRLRIRQLVLGLLDPEPGDTLVLLTGGE
jgi:hypothetical protein